MHRTAAVIVLALVSVAAYAQPGPPPDPGDVPIGGLGYLIAAGGLLGFEHLRRRFRGKNRK